MVASSQSANSAAVDFIEHFAVLLEAEGLPRVAGRLLGMLLVSEGAQSLDELARQLAVSKASVSVNARLLEQRGVVERVGRQGDRRDYYTIADDILERTLEQRVSKIRRFQEVFAAARARCDMKPVARRRLERMDDAYRHLLAVTSRALQDLKDRGSRPDRPTPSRTPSR